MHLASDPYTNDTVFDVLLTHHKTHTVIYNRYTSSSAILNILMIYQK